MDKNDSTNVYISEGVLVMALANQHGDAVNTLWSQLESVG